MQAGGAMAGEIEPCKNCDDSGIDPLWEDDGQPSGMDLHGSNGGTPMASDFYPGPVEPGCCPICGQSYLGHDDERHDKVVDGQISEAADALVSLALLRRPRLAKAVKKVAKFLDLDESVVREAMVQAIHEQRLMWTQDGCLEMPDGE